MIERHLQLPATRIIGFDSDEKMLDRDRIHVAQASPSSSIELLPASVRDSVKKLAGTVTVFISNLPWGERIGTRRLYEKLFRTFSTLAATGARAAFLTQDPASLLHAQSTCLPEWHIASTTTVGQRGFHPTLFVLQHSAARRKLK